MRLLPYGADALLAEVAEPGAVLPLRAAALALPGVLDAVAGAQTVLVEFDLGLTSRAAVRAGLEIAPVGQPLGSAVDAAEIAGATNVTVELPVVYDGPDLAFVAELTGLSEDEVVSRHSSGSYTVRFCGFAPGFAYLDGLDPALQVPRRATPRTDVPAGAVAIAGEFAAVYPRRSPGGWQLLGTTSESLWDVGATPPTRLSPGRSVRFVPK